MEFPLNLRLYKLGETFSFRSVFSREETREIPDLFSLETQSGTDRRLPDKMAME